MRISTPTILTSWAVQIHYLTYFKDRKKDMMEAMKMAALLLMATITCSKISPSQSVFLIKEPIVAEAKVQTMEEQIIRKTILTMIERIFHSLNNQTAKSSCLKQQKKRNSQKIIKLEEYWATSGKTTIVRSLKVRL
jgi:hypothetical protein